MKKISVFYHVFSPANEKKNMIYWWLDEQLSLIKKSGLSDLAEINTCITAPIHMEWGKHGSNITTFIDKKYPFVNILSLRDTGEPLIYEGQTLDYLYKYCLNNDAYVLYIHSKGIANSTINTYQWTKVLNHYCIEKWQLALKAFQNSSIDIIGVADQLSGEHCISGNFWWASSDYIRKLPHPIDSSQYQLDKEKFPGQKNYRWTFEDWYQLQKPRVFHLHNTNIRDHYTEPYYF